MMQMSKAVTLGLAILAFMPCRAAEESQKPMMKAVIIHEVRRPGSVKVHRRAPAGAEGE